MTMAHAQCALLSANAIMHEAHTNKEIDSVDCGIADDENKVHMRKSTFRTLRYDHSNTLLQNSELSPKKTFQYLALDTETSLPTSDFSQGRKRFSDVKNVHSGETTMMPILLISEASCDNTLFDYDRTPYSRCSAQECTEKIKIELLQAGCQIDNPDSGIERTPVLPNHSHFNFSHSPEPTVSIPLSTYFNLLTTHRHTSHPCVTRAAGPACCRCQSWPGVAHFTASSSAPADLQELGLKTGQCDHNRDRRVKSEAGFLKHQMKTLIEGRVYDEDACKLQKKQSHLYHHSPSSPPETVKTHRFNSQILSCTSACSKYSDDLFNNGPKLFKDSDDLFNNGPKLFKDSDDLFNNGPKLSSHPTPNSGTSSFQVNSFHLPSPSLISKSSFDQLTKELLRTKEIKKSLEEENEKLRQELLSFHNNKVHEEEKRNLLGGQVQTNLIQTSGEVSKLLSVKSSLEKKVLEQGCEIQVLNETIQKLQRKLIIKKGNSF